MPQTEVLRNLPEWNLADLYPSPSSAKFAGDLKRGEADAKVFNKGFSDQTGDLWSRDGRLLATSHQIVYFRA